MQHACLTRMLLLLLLLEVRGEKNTMGFPKVQLEPSTTPTHTHTHKEREEKGFIFFVAIYQSEEYSSVQYSA